MKKTIQRRGARLDNRQATFKVSTIFGIELRLPKPCAQAARDRFDRSERVVQFVTQHSNQPLPCAALFLSQRPANVGQHNQSVGHALFPELAPPDQPAGARTIGRHRYQRLVRSVKALAQPDLIGGTPQKANRSLLQKFLTRGIHHSKHPLRIECE